MEQGQSAETSVNVRKATLHHIPQDDRPRLQLEVPLDARLDLYWCISTATATGYSHVSLTCSIPEVQDKLPLGLITYQHLRAFGAMVVYLHAFLALTLDWVISLTAAEESQCPTGHACSPPEQVWPRWRRLGESGTSMWAITASPKLPKFTCTGRIPVVHPVASRCRPPDWTSPLHV